MNFPRHMKDNPDYSLPATATFAPPGSTNADALRRFRAGELSGIKMTTRSGFGVDPGDHDDMRMGLAADIAAGLRPIPEPGSWLATYIAGEWTPEAAEAEAVRTAVYEPLGPDFDPDDRETWPESFRIKVEQGEAEQAARLAEVEATYGPAHGFTARPKAPSKYLFRPIEDYLKGVQTDVPWLLHHFLYFGGTSMLAGIWKGGKSQFTASLIRARLDGRPFLGCDLPAGPTYVVTEEGGISLYEKYSGTRGLAIVDAQTMAFANQTLWDVLESIREDVTDAQAFVVIDTLAVLAGIEDENDAIKVTAAIRQVMNFAQSTGAAVLIIDHTGKQTSGLNHGKSIRGSGAKPATLDIYGVLDYGATKTQRKLSIEGRVRDARADLVLDFDPDTQAYRLVGEQNEQTTYDKQTAGIPMNGEGWTISQLVELWGISRSTAQDRVKALCDAGRMRRERRPNARGNAEEWRHWSSLPVAPVVVREGRDDPEGTDDDDQ